MNRQDILVIGGGAAGILAALAAKENGASVAILERNPRIGKKILVTGNGRCNYTNVTGTPSDYNHPDFVSPAMKAFGPGETIGYFQKMGIVPKVEDLGKTFPLSEQASSILDVLLYRIQTLGIPVFCDSQVLSLGKKGGIFRVRTQDGNTFESDRIILATGGKAMPSTGSDGSGYGLAAELGHSLVPVFPSLVKLKLDSPLLKGLDGVKIDGKVQLIQRQDILQEEEGDVLFTEYGISGPTILQLSRKANELVLKGEEPVLKVVLVRTLSHAEIRNRFENGPDLPLDFSLVGLIHKRLIPAILKTAGIVKQNAPVSSLTPKEIDRITELLSDWRFPIIGSKGFEDAQVTAGGIDTQEINPETLESRLVHGLYFAGEIIDVDAPCGGFNLQWAWSSGHLAGFHAARDGK
jgi:hypothetical protein